MLEGLSLLVKNSCLLAEVVVENFLDAEMAHHYERLCCVFGNPNLVSAQRRSEAHHVVLQDVKEESAGSSLRFCRCYQRETWTLMKWIDMAALPLSCFSKNQRERNLP